MKQITKSIQSVQLFQILILLSFIICAFYSETAAETVSQKKKEIFENKISDIAERYIGIQYKLGGDPEKSATVDNSHLICLIYSKTAKQAGLKFRGYMPMKELLRNTIKIRRDELKNGDLIVIDDDHAALIYKFEKRDKFYMIYASFKRQQVVSFNSKNVVFEAYWLKNLKGFFRLTKNMFIPDN